MIARTLSLEDVTMTRIAWALGLACGLSLAVDADQLIMRDGSRIQGELLSVRGGVIEFEERRGFGRGRTLRVDREEVLRIELDDYGRSTSDNSLDVGGRPSGLRERQVVVSADVPWNDTGIDVRSGQTVFFEATGNVRWGRDRRDGPEGESNSPNNPGRPIPNRPAAALIGKVGTSSTDVFFIGGEEGPIRIRSSGRLYLGINDDFLQDNSGNFRVVVHY
jgi:hypothetical protein